jgi:hypothetical protein
MSRAHFPHLGPPHPKSAACYRFAHSLASSS